MIFEPPYSPRAKKYGLIGKKGSLGLNRFILLFRFFHGGAKFCSGGATFSGGCELLSGGCITMDFHNS